MNARLITLAGLLSLSASTAAAQTANTIGFETDCAGNPTPGAFVGNFKQVPSGLYAPCGVASISSGGLTGQQQLALNGGLPIIGMVNGITGSVCLAGAYNFTTFASVTIVFATPVNEISFDALDLDNQNGLSVELDDVNGAPVLAVEKPTAANKIVHYARTSTTPILRAVISYQPNPIVLPPGDGWYLDQLHFNVWKCGDKELEGAAGEACDDGNTVQCDGCNNNCQPSGVGCFDGSTCIPDGTLNGCIQCSLSAAPDATGNIRLSPRPVGTTCDDGLFCTLPGSCDAAGTCQSAPNTCNDSIICTTDACDEANDLCTHVIAPDWCLVDGQCYADGWVNPADACQLCTPGKNTKAWDALPSGSQCGNPSCTNGIATAASLCNATGQCEAGMQHACPLASCVNTVSCDGMCSIDTECPREAFCDATSTSCMLDLPPGSACVRNAQCDSNACVDGVCCNRSCNDACEACNQAGHVGTCTPLPSMTVDPAGLCKPGEYCGANGECAMPPPAADAGTPIVVPIDGGMMMELRPTGTACDRNDVCGTGFCSDGVCCDRACDGVCESCAAVGFAPGQCLPHSFGEDPDNECGASGAVCNGINACTRFETRGNGLCAMSAGFGRNDRWLLVSALAAFGAVLAARRRRRR